jgi:pimeloyl-ACP methyl ester carboxylesterase
MPRCALATALALALVLWTMPARTALAPVARAAELPASIPDVFVHVPRGGVSSDAPLQVLVALHGMGGNGSLFASGLLADADRNHWLLVAPTILYGDWTDPGQVAREDPRLIAWLGDYLAHLQEYVGLPVKDRVLLLGHSRGAQLAHRFALFQPERVLGVAALAAGTYTLPFETSQEGTQIRFPFGLADLATISGHAFRRVHLIEDTEFWLGVGSEDNNPSDLPRQWDSYLGTTRVQRAGAFQAALHRLGARSVLVEFPGERHAMSEQMIASADGFLRGLDLEHAQPEPVVGSPTPLRPPRGRARF